MSVSHRNGVPRGKPSGRLDVEEQSFVAKKSTSSVFLKVLVMTRCSGTVSTARVA